MSIFCVFDTSDNMKFVTTGPDVVAGVPRLLPRFFYSRRGRHPKVASSW